MVLGKQLKAWFAKFEKYKVTYRGGFFQLQNLANSPYTTVESFGNMPFCKHDKEKQLLTASTVFFDAQFYYAELEEGLWLYVSGMQCKRNVEFIHLYDKSLPIDYHFINLHYNTTKFTGKSVVINGMVLTDKTWTILKAGVATKNCHFKNSNESNVSLYFTTEWFNKQVKSTSYIANSSLERFFKSDSTHMLLPDIDKGSDLFYDNFLALAKQNLNNSKKKEIKALLTDFIKQFIGIYNNDTVADYDFKLSDTDRKNVQRVEKHLMDNLLHTFPGIDALAKKAGVSPTKLKADFKVAHSRSMYQYYRHHQMTLANKILTQKATTVKEVANLLGYDNAGKFTAAFKNQFGVLPSEVIR